MTKSALFQSLWQKGYNAEEILTSLVYTTCTCRHEKDVSILCDTHWGELMGRLGASDG